ncbi:hypothetical protein BVRB_003400 [Beta vulgaris subsp. vulgaris]|uniref:TF-B3 domain-containing protein n=1 Tax=Beta vulgaris subsp. vulgaris TaxID=3555 RepID=A0A0J8DYM3_BETVV|nr:hypothetical protein BVRB_003400 [Beta vulgaris subsp. vulgaris]
MPKRFRLNDNQENAQGKIQSVFSQAEEIRSKLDPRYPSFIKVMLKSHVTGGFWMGLPASFCEKHLPLNDTSITLETQSKKLYKAKYLVRKAGLSGGWKGFAICERLFVGDVLVFHLVSAAKFKEPARICDVTAPSSNTLSTFENFSIVINNLLDYELADNIQWSYYELCCSQNGLLHDHLPKWMNHILVQGIIIETVTIADALRQCELSTSKDTFVLWDKTLNALELLGMNIGFLRAHLDRLQKIVHDPEVATFRQKCLELCSENARSKDKIRCLKEKLAEMKIMHNKRGADIENLKAKVENHELKFQEQVHALW